MSELKLVTYYTSGLLPLRKAAGLPYTDIILSFILTSGIKPFSIQFVTDMNAPFSLRNPEIKSAINEIKNNGKKVLVSFGEITLDNNIYWKVVGYENDLAKSIARFIRENNLDGINIYWSDTAAFLGVSGYNGVSFLANLTKSLRKYLPAPDYTISHTTHPLYLEKGSGMDGYTKVMEQAGEDIDWLNIQFYDNPPWCETPENIVSSCRQYCKLPGISPEKLIVGLPVTPEDANCGYFPINKVVDNIISPLQTSQSFGGIMNWQFSSDKDFSWATQIGEVLGLTVPQPVAFEQ